MMGDWCDFCQMFHTSRSCFHPGVAELEAARERILELETIHAECAMYREELENHIDELEETVAWLQQRLSKIKNRKVKGKENEPKRKS